MDTAPHEGQFNFNSCWDTMERITIPIGTALAAEFDQLIAIGFFWWTEGGSNS
jgi:hypothetical protein